MRIQSIVSRCAPSGVWWIPVLRISIQVPETLCCQHGRAHCPGHHHCLRLLSESIPTDVCMCISSDIPGPLKVSRSKMLCVYSSNMKFSKVWSKRVSFCLLPKQAHVTVYMYFGSHYPRSCEAASRLCEPT